MVYLNIWIDDAYYLSLSELPGCQGETASMLIQSGENQGSAIETGCNPNRFRSAQQPVVPFL